MSQSYPLLVNESLEPTPTSYVQVCALASGGMGRVDLAMRKEGAFQRLYAIKRLHPHLRSDSDFRTMFLDEARVAGLIQHPNVVSVLDVGEDSAGPFLVMNFIQGVPLSRLLTLARKKEESLPIQVCARIAAEVARGLHAAHEVSDHDGRPLHLVHRDLSPQNILVGYSGNVRITDFGIAKAAGQGTKTATGVIKGKTSYMSPEQLRFEEPDRRSDLFALGIILFELLSGERLYKNREGSDGVRRILNDPPPDIGEVRLVPPALEQLLLELLSKKPEYRPATAGEVAQRLEEMLASMIAEGGSVDLAHYVENLTKDHRAETQGELQEAIARARRESTHVPKLIRAPERSSSPWRYLGAAAVLTVVLGGAGFFVMSNQPDTLQPQDDLGSVAESAPPGEEEPEEPAPASEASGAAPEPLDLAPEVEEVIDTPSPPTQMVQRSERNRPNMRVRPPARMTPTTPATPMEAPSEPSSPMSAIIMDLR